MFFQTPIQNSLKSALSEGGICKKYFRFSVIAPPTFFGRDSERICSMLLQVTSQNGSKSALGKRTVITSHSTLTNTATGGHSNSEPGTKPAASRARIACKGRSAHGRIRCLHRSESEDKRRSGNNDTFPNLAFSGAALAGIIRSGSIAIAEKGHGELSRAAGYRCIPVR